MNTQHRPIVFCCAIVTPVFAVLLAARISEWTLPKSAASSYTALSIILCSALSAIILACGLAIWSWIRGERPRLLAFVGPIISIWFLGRLLFASG